MSWCGYTQGVGYVRYADMDVTCPVCGKVFRPTVDWGYRYGHYRLCSYKCVMQRERQHKARIREKDLQAEQAKAEVERWKEADRTRQKPTAKGMTLLDQYKHLLPEMIEANKNGETWVDIAARYKICSDKTLQTWASLYRHGKIVIGQDGLSRQDRGTAGPGEAETKGA